MCRKPQTRRGGLRSKDRDLRVGSAAAGLESPRNHKECDKMPGVPSTHPTAGGRRARAWGLCSRRHRLSGDAALTMAESRHPASSLRSADPCRYRQSPPNLGHRLQIPRWWYDGASETKALAPRKPAPFPLVCAPDCTFLTPAPAIGQGFSSHPAKTLTDRSWHQSTSG